MKQQQQGFTLIELVMVIVILGILAATALPKFVDLQKDAKIASLNGMRAALQSGASMIHAKALIENVSPSATSAWLDMNDNSTTTAADGDVQVKYLYPIAGDNGLTNLVDMDGFTRSGSEFRLGGTDGCEVVYAESASAGAQPTYTVTDTNC